jgi:hypothetical protein
MTTPPTPSPDNPAEATRRERRRQPDRARTFVHAVSERCPRAWAMLILTIAVVGLNVLVARTERAVSLVDEREHIDFLVQASDFKVPRGGGTLEQETLRELCTRGSQAIKWPTHCPSGHLDAKKFAIGGIDIAGDQPLYYLLTAPTARALRAVVPFEDSLVSWGRFLGSVWLLIAFYLTLRAGDALQLPRARVVAALLIVAAVPATLEATTTVATDATAFASGAAVLLAALAWERTGRSQWLVALFGAAAVSVLLNNTNAIGVLVVLTYLGLRALASRFTAPTDHERPWHHYVAVAVGLVIASWFGIQVLEKQLEKVADPAVVHTYTKSELKTKSRLDPLRHEATVDTFGIDNVLGPQALFGMFPPTADIAPPVSRSVGPHAPWYLVAAGAAAFLFTAALIANIFGFSWTDRRTLLGVSTLISLIAGGALLVLYRRYVNGSVETAVPRFGISALPALGLVLAGASKTRVAQWVVGGVAVGLFVTALYTLV